MTDYRIERLEASQNYDMEIGILLENNNIHSYLSKIRI